jgi:hypothetical protein
MSVHGTADDRSYPLSWRRAIPPSARDRVHNTLIDAKAVGSVYVRIRPQLRHGLITSATRLVLDGYPRSANAYAEWAFRYANGDSVPIAVRLHSPRAVREGVRRGVPTIVLIRPPRDAVASWLQYKPGVNAANAFRRYARYYRRIMPLRDRVVVAPFDEVVADFGAVIRRCNERFGTDFEPYPGGPVAEAWVRSQIENAWAYDETGLLPEHRVPRPSRNRDAAEEVLEPVMHDPLVRENLEAALLTWQRFLVGVP